MYKIMCSFSSFFNFYLGINHFWKNNSRSFTLNLKGNVRELNPFFLLFSTDKNKDDWSVRGRYGRNLELGNSKLISSAFPEKFPSGQWHKAALMVRQRWFILWLVPFVIVWFNYWGWVTHICVKKVTIIGSENGLSPGRCQAIAWTNAGKLLSEPLETHFSELLIEIHTFVISKGLHLKMSSGKWRPFCLGLNVLKIVRQRKDSGGGTNLPF